MDTDSRADCLCMRRGETSCYPPYAAWCMDPEREECALPGSCSFSGHSEQDPFASYPCLFASQQSSGACVGAMLICGATLSRRNSYPGGLFIWPQKVQTSSFEWPFPALKCLVRKELCKKAQQSSVQRAGAMNRPWRWWTFCKDKWVLKSGQWFQAHLYMCMWGYVYVHVYDPGGFCHLSPLSQYGVLIRVVKWVLRLLKACFTNRKESKGMDMKSCPGVRITSLLLYNV